MSQTPSPPVVLVVDDDWMIREIIQAHLDYAGYTVLMAHSGEKALEITAQRTPDLVILDLRLQGIGGHEVCARLKADPRTRDSAVLITTAMDDDESRLRAVEAGADDFLPKPFDALVMLTRVKSLLRIKTLQDELRHRQQRLETILIRHVGAEAARRILDELDAQPVRSSRT
ncbi:MAG: response regulator [Chloroflexi bacterium]|nr:response regulator [Chloroflexota bacterium]